MHLPTIDSQGTCYFSGEYIRKQYVQNYKIDQHWGLRIPFVSFQNGGSLKS